MLESLHALMAGSGALLLSILALIVGAALVHPVWGQGPVARATAAFPLGAVLSLVVLDIIPATIEVTGLRGWLYAAMGMLIPLAYERASARSPEGQEPSPSSLGYTPKHWTLALAIMAMLLHESLDGATLASAALEPAHGAEEHRHASEGLLLAVLLHRIPVGAAAWRLAKGFGVAWAPPLAIALLSLSTIVGFVAAGHIFPTVSSVAVASFQALAAGSFLHILWHHLPLGVAHSKAARRADLLGMAIGLFLFAAVALSH